MKFNTAIAALMTLLNDIYAVGHITRDELKIFITLLCPFAPHICEEMWEQTGEKTLLSLEKWPSYDESKTIDENVEIAVQLCGKMRGTVVIPINSEQDFVENAVKSDDRFASQFAGKTVIKVIYVKNKLINFVVK